MITHLSQIKLRTLLVVHSLDLHEGGVGTRVPLASLVAEDAGFYVETVGVGVGGGELRVGAGEK